MNEVHIEGFITKKQWMYGGDKFFRVAIYRDPDRPRKKENGDREKPDYITVKVPNGGFIQLEASHLIQVHGWLESREYEYTLADFLEDADAEEITVDGDAANAITHRGSTWIVAERLVPVNK